MKHGCAVVLMICHAAMGQAAWPFHKHKSTEELSRMDGSALVREYCRENRWSTVLHGEYQDEVLRQIRRRENVEAALRTVAQALDEYVPSEPSKRTGQRFADAGTAVGLLDMVDFGAVRVRAIPVGRVAIASADAYISRKAQAGENDPRRQETRAFRFQGEVLILGHLRGLNRCDYFIQNNLEMQRGIVLSEPELRAFVDFLIAKDPYYPSWSEMSMDRDPKTGRFVGAVLVRQLEPYIAALREFRADGR